MSIENISNSFNRAQYARGDISVTPKASPSFEDQLKQLQEEIVSLRQENERLEQKQIENEREIIRLLMLLQKDAPY